MGFHRICAKCLSQNKGIRPSTIYRDTAPTVGLSERCHYCGNKTRSPKLTTEHPENHVIFDCSPYHGNEK